MIVQVAYRLPLAAPPERSRPDVIQANPDGPYSYPAIFLPYSLTHGCLPAIISLYQ